LEVVTDFPECPEDETMTTCDNCGTRLSDGMCPNCHEELFILTTQAYDLDGVEFSDEFAAKVAEQREELAAKKGRPLMSALRSQERRR
jgi:hypothetical protein